MPTGSHPAARRIFGAPLRYVQGPGALSETGPIAAALGPPVGGILVQVSWHWIFLINVPIGLVAAAIGVRLLDDPEPELGVLLALVDGALHDGALAAITGRPIRICISSRFSMFWIACWCVSRRSAGGVPSRILMMSSGQMRTRTVFAFPWLITSTPTCADVAGAADVRAEECARVAGHHVHHQHDAVVEVQRSDRWPVHLVLLG